MNGLTSKVMFSKFLVIAGFKSIFLESCNPIILCAFEPLLYSSAGSNMLENDDEAPTTTAVAITAHSSQSLSRRTRSLKGDNNGSYKSRSVDGG